MIVSITGAPCLSVPTESAISTVLATFDPDTNTTVIDCDVDIVTLGIAAGILQQQYEGALAQLDPRLADLIKTTISEVLANG